MAQEMALFCGSAVGINDPSCGSSTLMAAPTLKPPHVTNFEEMIGYFIVVLALVLVYFCILFAYKLIQGFSLRCSAEFAIYGAKRHCIP
jgi:hypothetical protein